MKSKKSIQFNTARELLNKLHLQSKPSKNVDIEKAISFYKKQWAVEFFFKRAEPDIAAELMAMIQQKERIDNATFQAGLIEAVMTKKGLKESIIGKEARGLNAYQLSKVTVLKPIKKYFCKIPYSSHDRTNVYNNKTKP